MRAHSERERKREIQRIEIVIRCSIEEYHCAYSVHRFSLKWKFNFKHIDIACTDALDTSLKPCETHEIGE